ncbi:MAG: DNA polymerase III subunit gamma/tau [Anaerolineae bacterium]|nr:DNA polymerase III subunit gamma/tau [Anaerolineae bacterium]
MSQALYRKYRPMGWAAVYGQDHIVRTIQNAMRSGRVGHAYLFAGPRGTGKTSTARLLAKAVNCLHSEIDQRPCNTCTNCQAVNDGRFLDLIEIDAASNTSVDDVRDLRDKINFSPTQGTYKVYIIDEVHMLSTSAFNALLKTLEEPPPHVIFILATTEVHKIPATVLSRCQRHAFRRIPVQDIVGQLQTICDGEGFDVPEDVLYLIARQSNGGMRDAISLLDQLASTGDALSLDLAQEVLGTATNQSVVDVADAVLARDAAAGLRAIHHALDEGSDPRQFGRQVVEYLRNLILVRVGNADMIDASEELRTQMARQAQAFEPERLVEVIEHFNAAASDRNTSWFPGLPLELAMAQSVERKAQAMVMPAQAAAAKANEPQTNAVGAPTPTHAAGTHTPEAVPAAPDEFESNPVLLENGKTLTIQDVNHNWRRLLALVRKHNPSTHGLLNSCKILALKNGELVLGFQSDIVRSKMEDGKNIDLTRRAIAHLMEAKLDVRCVVISDKVDFSSMDPTEAGSGMVGEAINLGGRVQKKESFQ